MSLAEELTPTSASPDSKQLRLPNKSINSEYLYSILLAIRDMDGIIKSLQRSDDIRPKLMARQIINRILDDEIKYSLLDKFNQGLEQIENGEGDDYVKGARVIAFSQDAVGEVNSYLDEYFGLHKGQVIGDV